MWFQAEAEGNDAMSRKKREVGAVPVKSRRLVQLAAGSDLVWALPSGKSIRTVDGCTRSRVGGALRTRGAGVGSVEDDKSR